MKFDLSQDEVKILVEALEYRGETTPENWWNDEQDETGKPYTSIANHLLERFNLDLVNT